MGKRTGLLSPTACRSRFDAALAEFERPGNRYNAVGRVVYWGKASGLSSDDLVENAHARGVTNRDADIRRLYEKSAGGREGGWGRFTRTTTTPHLSKEERAERRRALLPKSERDFVPVTLRGLGEGVTSADLRAMSPTPIPRMAGEQSALHLHALGTDWRYSTWCGTILDHDLAERLGRRCKTAYVVRDGNDDDRELRERGIIRPDDLVRHFRTTPPTPDRFPTHISLNPQTGRLGTTSICDGYDTVAIYSHALIEFDDLKTADGLPDPAAVEIVAGLVKWSRENGGLLKPLSVVWTGAKSLHTVVSVPVHPRRIPGTADYDPTTTDEPNDDDRGYYDLLGRKILDLFASADDLRFRIDTNGVSASMHTRLAGGINLKTGRRAELLYADLNGDECLF